MWCAFPCCPSAYLRPKLRTVGKWDLHILSQRVSGRWRGPQTLQAYGKEPGPSTTASPLNRNKKKIGTDGFLVNVMCLRKSCQPLLLAIMWHAVKGLRIRDNSQVRGPEPCPLAPMSALSASSPTEARGCGQPAQPLWCGEGVSPLLPGHLREQLALSPRGWPWGGLRAGRGHSQPPEVPAEMWRWLGGPPGSRCGAVHCSSEHQPLGTGHWLPLAVAGQKISHSQPKDD